MRVIEEMEMTLNPSKAAAIVAFRGSQRAQATAHCLLNRGGHRLLGVGTGESVSSFRLHRPRNIWVRKSHMVILRRLRLNTDCNREECGIGNWCPFSIQSKA